MACWNWLVIMGKLRLISHYPAAMTKKLFKIYLLYYNSPKGFPNWTFKRTVAKLKLNNLNNLIRRGPLSKNPALISILSGVSSSSILPSDFGEQRPRQQQPQFDIVQYDATIPDDDSEDIPILLADPFR